VSWTGASARGIPFSRVFDWVSAAPARLAGLAGLKGSIAPGADADLIVWDPDAESTVDPAGLHHRHPVTPYAGARVRGRVELTIVRGEIVFDRGDLAPRPHGRMIARPVV
jgi:allantoinase